MCVHENAFINVNGGVDACLCMLECMCLHAYIPVTGGGFDKYFQSIIVPSEKEKNPDNW